ncbi:MAG: winged helix DNA-binding protein [Spirochaetaceae bacterium]|jgi:DNA-binding MarR family transcriptional regulator|nr:winged helix DNA-binding protein [Spirochaetaceae bacterium]
MKDALKQDLLRSLFCFKKATVTISHYMSKDDEDGLSIAEISALCCIDHGCGKTSGQAERTAHHAMHEILAVTKAAVSQMLGSLEKRGFIWREIDQANRRKIVITLTDRGKAAVDMGEQRRDALLSRVVKRFGEKDAEHFVQLLTRFSDIVDEETRKAD